MGGQSGLLTSASAWTAVPTQKFAILMNIKETKGPFMMHGSSSVLLQCYNFLPLPEEWLTMQTKGRKYLQELPWKDNFMRFNTSFSELSTMALIHAVNTYLQDHFHGLAHGNMSTLAATAQAAAASFLLPVISTLSSIQFLLFFFFFNNLTLK